MTATLHRPEVTAFVAAVRRELDDLSVDEIDELTGGLEADLDDALADRPDPDGDPVTAFGAPGDYAAELRAAAGLPPRAASPGRRRVGARLNAVRGRWQGRLTSQPWWPAVRDFAVSLRPAWWVVRAGVLAVLFTSSFGGLLLLGAVLVVLSVQMGRRRVAKRGRWSRLGVTAVNVVAALALLPTLEQATTPNATYVGSSLPPDDGLWLNGSEVRNVLPYDSQGKPLRDVQLFDEDGRRLSVGASARSPLWTDGPAETSGTAQVPAVTERGEQVWNVYPLRQVEVRSGDEFDMDDPQPTPVGTPDYPTLGATQVAPLLSPTSTPSPAPSSLTPSSSPTLSSSPKPSSP